jgi:predicted acyltransferase
MFWITGGTDLFLALFIVLDAGVARFLLVQFNHSRWNGFTFYDLIFPLFIFVAGLSIPFSITKRIERGDDRRALYLHIAWRTLLLILLGVAHNRVTLDPFALRLPGVLQRVAICSGVASIIAMNTKVRTQVVIFGGILLAYWGMLALIPEPVFGAGDLSPHGNLVGYVDRMLLPFPNRWCCYEFGDSEGILSTIPAVATALLGVLAGHRLRAAGTTGDRVRWFCTVGAACIVAGLVWGVVFPINKNLWTSSYVLFSGGWCLGLLALFHWTFDGVESPRWAFFFTVIGLNAVVMYVLQGIIRFQFLHKLLGASADLALLVAFLELAARWSVVYYLYRRRWFVKF